MPIRIEMGTDIAMVGVWDPGEDDSELTGDYLAFIESEAKAGRLFFINTGADGGYAVDVYLEQQPAPEELDLYTEYDRAYLIKSRSGRLIAGGVEDYGKSKPGITSESDELALTPGHYALRFFELDEDRYLTGLSEHIGEQDMAYYSSQLGGCGTGCLLFVAALVSGAISWVLTDVLPWLWFVPAVLFVIGVVYLTVRSRALAKDQRFQEIASRIEAHEERYPGFIFVLRLVSDEDNIQGGWHDLF